LGWLWQLVLAHFGGSRTEHPGKAEGLLLLLPERSTEAILLRAGLDDVGLVGEPVGHGLAKACVGKTWKSLFTDSLSGCGIKFAVPVLTCSSNVEKRAQ